MSDLSLSRSSSFTSIVPSQGSSPIVRPTTTPTVQQPLEQPISHEAQQMVRQSSQQQVPTTVATDQDIQSIHNEIQSLTSALPSSTISEHTQLANNLQDHAPTETGIRKAITFMGDHPQAGMLLEKLTAALASGNPSDLRTVRNNVVDALRSQGREVNSTRENAHARVDRQMTTERGPVDDRWLIRKALIGGMDRSSHATDQQERLAQQVATHQLHATQFRDLANRLQDNPDGNLNISTLRGALNQMSDHPQVATIKAGLRAAELAGHTIADPDVQALRNQIVDILRGEVTRLTEVSQGVLQGSEHLSHFNREGPEEIIANLSMATSVVSSTNSIVKMATNSVGGFMGSAASAVGASFGGLQIVTEAVALRRNVGRLTESLSRRESAQLVLASPSERPKMIRDMEQQITALREPRWYRTKSGREADIAKLEAKIASLRSMGDTPTTPQARAIAQQVVDTTSTTFKALRVLKNVAGIVAGAVAIAVAVGALATPVGWALAGVVVAATVGLWIYNKVQTSAKESKIESLMQNRTQISHQIVNLEHSPAARNPDSLEGRTLASLRDLQQRNTIQLLTVSPRHAASEIIKGLKATPPDPQMQTLATQVLNVPVGMTLPPFSAQQETELQEFMMRGMPMQPKL